MWKSNYLLSLLLSIFFITGSPPTFAQCDTLFLESSDPKRRKITHRDTFYHEHYAKPGTLDLRNPVVEVFRGKDGSIYYTTLLVQEFSSSDGTITRVSEPTVNKGAPVEIPTPILSALLGESSPSVKIPAEFQHINPKAWYERFRPLIEVTNEKFETRRDWPSEFSEKNVDVAKKYLRYSTYIEVLDSNGELIGGSRVITLRARDPLRLPEFEYLGIRPHPENKTEIQREIGTFFVDESLPGKTRTLVLLEIWGQICRNAFGGFGFSTGKEQTQYNQSFHTYADRRSLALYLPLGFTHLDRYILNGVEVDHRGKTKTRDIAPISKETQDGKTLQWWPITMDAATIFALRELVAFKRLSSLSEDEIISRIRERPYRDASSLEFGATFEQSLRFATERSEFGGLCLQGVIEGLFEADLHHRVSSEKPAYSQRARIDQKKFDRRIELFKKTLLTWLDSDNFKNAMSVLMCYLGSNKPHHPKLLEFILHTALPKILERVQQSGRFTHFEHFVELMEFFIGLNHAIPAETWIKHLKDSRQTIPELDSDLIESLRFALFGDHRRFLLPDKSQWVNQTHFSIGALMGLLELPASTDKNTFRAYFLEAAKAQISLPETGSSQ